VSQIYQLVTDRIIHEPHARRQEDPLAVVVDGPYDSGTTSETPRRSPESAHRLTGGGGAGGGSEVPAMIEIARGDLLRTNAEALVNTVNCVGVMGAGLALQFRKAFPEMFLAYKHLCHRGGLQPGRIMVYRLERLSHPRYIINFPTKRHWRDNSRIEDIDAGLAALVQEIHRHHIRSVAIPPLGCGLGGLDWGDVRPRIEAAFRSQGTKVLLFEPSGCL
jgi:O-acetyl-ADP-ribose deacetylase (regulator of RNase III)